MEILNLSLDTQKILAKNILDYIELYNVPNKETFAIQCGISKMQVYNVLNFKSTPTLDFIDKIAKGMGISVVELLTENYYSQFEKKIVKKNS
jgi:transcriptional regulator with XRE-family HTH domain